MNDSIQEEKLIKTIEKDIWLSGIMGVVVGDALGVPIEFCSREELEEHPVTTMIGYGTYDQPEGTWSDDSSMTLATLDSIKNGYDLKDIMDKFVDWFKDGEYTPFGEVFDVGVTTYKAIYQYEKELDVRTCGEISERSNGNGSLMRIMPVCLYLIEEQEKRKLSENEAIQIIHEVSGLTHNHLRSKIGCGLYYFITKAIVEENEKLVDRVKKGLENGFTYYGEELLDVSELAYYERLRNVEQFKNISKQFIKSSGYVVDTLEAAIWCLLNTESYEQCVLKAVNLGSDTDTVGAVAGGLAGLYYGYDEIPENWLAVIKEREWIESLCRGEGREM